MLHGGFDDLRGVLQAGFGDGADKIGELLEAAFGLGGFEEVGDGGGEQGLVVRDRVQREENFAKRDVADAFKDVAHHPFEADLVAFVGEDAQNGQHVLHFLAVVETDAADDAVGDVQVHEDFFEGVGLGVGAVEDREIGVVGEFRLGGEQRDGAGDEHGLGLFVARDFYPDRLAFAHFGE